MNDDSKAEEYRISINNAMNLGKRDETRKNRAKLLRSQSLELE